MSALVWLNGALTAQPSIDLTDRNYIWGDGIFETIRAEDGYPLHLRRHWRRLRMGAAVLEIPMLFSDGALSAAVRALLEEESGGGWDAVHVTVTRGPTPRGLLPAREGMPTVMITTSPLAGPPGPAALIVASVTRRNEYSPLARIKVLSTLDGRLARQEAARNGADDALMLNSRGRLAGASAANAFFLFGDLVVTPPVDEGALPGVRRQLALDLIPGIAARPLMVEEALAADDILLTSSLALRSVSSLAGRPPPRAGALFERFSQAGL